MKRTHKTDVAISGDLYERIREVAENDGRSIAGIVEAVIRNELDREDFRRSVIEHRRQRYWRDRTASELTSDDVDVHAFGNLVVCTYRRHLVAIGVFPPGGTRQVAAPLIA